MSASEAPKRQNRIASGKNWNPPQRPVGGTSSTTNRPSQHPAQHTVARTKGTKWDTLPSLLEPGHTQSTKNSTMVLGKAAAQGPAASVSKPAGPSNFASHVISREADDPRREGFIKRQLRSKARQIRESEFINARTKGTAHKSPIKKVAKTRPRHVIRRKDVFIPSTLTVATLAKLMNVKLGGSGPILLSRLTHGGNSQSIGQNATRRNGRRGQL